MNQLPVKFDLDTNRVVIPVEFFVHTTTYSYNEQLLTISGLMAVEGCPDLPRSFDMTFRPDGDSWSIYQCFIWPDGE